MPKTKELKEPKDVKEPKSKSRSENEPIAVLIVPPVVESDARRVRREARADGFKALGDPTRLGICEFLATCAPQEQTAGDVCRAVTGDKKITAKVSHHLKELRRAGLIAMHKKGKNVLCALDAGGTQALSAYLSAWTSTEINETNNGNPLTSDAAQEAGNNDSTNLLDNDPHEIKQLANAA